MKEKDIISAYLHIRKIDQSIPDDVLDFMKEAALEKLRAQPVPEDTIQWFEVSEKRPILKTPLLVEFEDRNIAIALLDEDANRTAWMVKNNKTGQFWRNMLNPIVRWRYFMSKEMVEYHKTDTLSIIPKK